LRDCSGSGQKSGEKGASRDEPPALNIRRGANRPIPEGRERKYVLIAVEALMAENELLTPAEVAVMFRVNPKTVTRWARAGKISAVRTLGGHRRFRASEIRRFLEEVQDLQA
jgi:excisionase family DNA binding protein